MSNSTVAKHLNVSLANAIVMSQKLRNFHWYVNGEQFFELHARFEEYYNRFNTLIDDLAERILTVGQQPVKTLTTALSLATIKEIENAGSAHEMVSSILADFKLQREQLAKVIETAEKENDRGTVNLLDEISDQLEKDCWMLSAYLA